ncbi:MAG: hypothetical protein ABW252_15165 [Polyangiales bacterium]
MYKFWLSLALGAGLLACGTPDAPRNPREMEDGGTRPDDDDEDEETTSKPRSPDAGRGTDAGRNDAGRADAGRAITPRTDGGMTITPPNVDPSGGGTTGTGGNSGTTGGTPPASGGGDSTPPGGGDSTPPGGGGDSTPPGGGEPAPSGGGLGGGCGGEGECGGGLRCVTSVAAPMGLDLTATFPGGYCTQRCMDDAACGANGACPLVPLAGLSPDFSMCAINCNADGDCRDGYVCARVPALGSRPPSATKVCRPREPFGQGKPTIDELAEEFGPLLP